MADSWALALGAATALVGMSWLALSLPAHWQQVLSGKVPARPLRFAATVMLMVSLLMCLVADHPTIAVLVWVMMLSTSALTVALLLALSPRCLGILLTGRKNTPGVANWKHSN